ncbi:unnamed protein product [Acanthoscelides obtectus]|uniref:Uncharacterized protein n=1 Tax=Acanthoscelides obtectus TaxID=200917 RepID=A0A9P0JM28_ACAOB|nr:unnamed protein product [Acanthoscelides obtectus]CAK1673647.1 hypothetical protein AOBTE_LOCUS29404 [Acanthoscelides obtectus]
MRNSPGPRRQLRTFFISFLFCCTLLNSVRGYPSVEDMRYYDKVEISGDPGAHQLASWLAAQLRGGADLRLSAPPIEISPAALPYRLPLGIPLSATGKRNSEVTNAIIGSEETQKMYRDGKR